MNAIRLTLACALAVGALVGTADVSNDPIQWRAPRAPVPGTPQYEAVAAAYAFRTPDKAARFADGYAFAKAVYGRDYSQGAPQEAVVFSYDGAADPAGRTAAMQRVMDELEPGDVVAVKGTNGTDGVVFYAGDVYGDEHGRALVLHKYAGFVMEASAGGRLVNWPLADPTKLRTAKSFTLIRPLKDPAAKLAEKRAFPKGEISFSDDERVRAVQALAWARYLKGPSIQYDSHGIVSTKAANGSPYVKYSRLDYRRTVEESTPDRTGYTVCSRFPYEAYWELFRYGLGDDSVGHLSFDLTKAPAPDILVYKYDRTTNTKPAEEVLREARAALQPGDVISYANVGYEKKPGGHVMLYVGEVDGIGTILHSGGMKFEFGEGYDRVEYEGTMHRDDVDGYLFAPGRDGTYNFNRLIGREQFVILRPLKKDLKLTPEGRARARLPRFRCDRRVKGGLYGSVVSGAELTYGIELWNAAKEPCDVPVVETLPKGTEFASASKGCTVAGRTLTWPVTLRPGQKRIVSWKVKVTAKPGATIVAEGGSVGGLPSNRLTTEVVGRKVSVSEAFAWADANLAADADGLPACRVRGWAGGYDSAQPPRAERVMETRSRDLMVGDVVLSQKRGKGEKRRRIWVKAKDALVERAADGSYRPVPETEVTALLDSHFFMAFRPAADRSAEVAAFRETADAVCSFTSVTLLSNGVTRAEFTLRPEPECDIRCRIELPLAEKWNGELWGGGNSSSGGKIPAVGAYSQDGLAAVTTDLGTWRYVFGDRKEVAWPAHVRHDFFWRATHLMTVYGKRIVRAFYGKDAAHCYFRGGSCGGRQALSEAARFPADYDGILAGVPAATTSAASAQALNVYRMTHDGNGRELFTRRQLRIVADAAVEYMADKDVKPYAGKVLSNPFLSEPEIEGFLALAAKKDPALGSDDLQRRLKGIYMGYVHNGRRTCHGAAAGAFLGNERGMNFTNAGGLFMALYRKEKGLKRPVDWEDYEAAIALFGGEANATPTDLGAFRDRGGKLIMTTGWEDQTLPPSDHVAWYEDVAAAMGGYEKTQEFFRLFPLPGLAHGGGKGRIATGGGNKGVHMQLLRDWVTKGVKPDVFVHRWPSAKLTLPVPPYPLQCYQDDAGRWQTRRYPENLVRHPDPGYARCDLTPLAK